MIKFSAAKFMEKVEEPHRILMLDFLFDSIGNKTLEDFTTEKLSNTTSLIKQNCDNVFGSRKTFRKTNYFEKYMWISPYFKLRHFMLIVIRNPKGAILNNDDGSWSSESLCVVLFLDRMDDKIEYRRLIDGDNIPRKILQLSSEERENVGSL
ncbi:hypothetical protein CRE_08482 [Caenorhabditis remanei]|uniref:Uncharacterized protein n=1 Tax=Caenorhabditis remanei TaxID=31234 RepID=E3N6U2_CAERE|nr:hypothetical protein CRE_08482 [Caenorhabditis remanei]